MLCNWIRFSELSTLQCHRVTDPSKSRTRSAQITVWSRSVGFLLIREHVREAKRFLSCLPVLMKCDGKDAESSGRVFGGRGSRRTEQTGLVDMLKQVKLT